MSDNDTIYNSTHTNSSASIGKIVISVGLCADLLLLLLSTITFIIGVISWIMIRKFRLFKNYVFLNVILNNIMNIVTSLLYLLSIKYKTKDAVVKHFIGIPFLYFKLTINCWLVVLCCLFYMDFVKVLGCDVSRKYLKSNLFAWGFPLVSVLWNVFVMGYIENNAKIAAAIFMTTVFLPLLVNLFIYIRVVYALLNVNNHGTSDRCRRIQASTVIFFVSGLLMLLVPLQRLVTVPMALVMVMAHMQTLAINIYFFVVKMNRKIWKNYFVHRRRILNLRM